MEFVKTALPGVILIKTLQHKDKRGFFSEFYHKEKFFDYGIEDSFVQSNHSHSIQNTLRGMHYQKRYPQSKLVRCVRGEILDVAVDIRKQSPYYGQWVSKKLSSDNGFQLYIPEGFAHGFLVLSSVADVVYQCNNKYSSEDSFGISWNDPTLNIDWNIKTPILSDSDKKLPLLKELKK